MPTESGPKRRNIDLFDIFHKHDRVRNARVEELNRMCQTAKIECLSRPEIMWVAHIHRDKLARERRTNESGLRLKRKLGRHPDQQPRSKAGKAPGPVATHLRFTAVAVEVAHPKISPRLRQFDRKKPVCPHPAMAVAKARDRRLVERNSVRTVVADNKIVAGAVHFCKWQYHGLAGQTFA